MPANRVLMLLEAGDWGEDREMIAGLKKWGQYPQLLEAYRTLDQEALYKSRVHGSGHIHRVLLFAALIGWREGLEEGDLRQYFHMASYHDVGRTFDGFDIYHGARSALRLAALTGQTGERLKEMQAAVSAHSRPDRDMETLVRSYEPRDLDHALEMTRLLKDADNLDRVRLGDLKVKFLRHDSARDLAEFSRRLFRLDQEIKKTLLR